MNNKEFSPRLKNIPNKPGVYFFKDKKGKIIYVGKANDLRARVKQYFATREPSERSHDSAKSLAGLLFVTNRKALGQTGSSRRMTAKVKNQHPKIKALVSETAKIEWQECESGIDALIQEARLIKKHRPKFNVLLRDDKNYFFVGVSKEEYPCIFLTHQPTIIQKSKIKNQNYNPKIKSEFIGPFTGGKALKETLKLLRRIFPFRYCRKMPKKQCPPSRLAKEFSPYAVPKNKAEIRKNIRVVVVALKGEKQNIMQKLEQQMLKAARAERFDLAEKYKNQAEYMRNVFAHRRFLEESPIGGQPSRDWPKIQKQLFEYLNIKHLSRVEGYDISNIGGQYAVGSMVVFTDGLPDKSQYRKFKINPVRSRARPVRDRSLGDGRSHPLDRAVSNGARALGTSPKDRGAATSNGIKYSGETPDDPKMIAEILIRRMRHIEWPTPDLIIVDGGITQLNAARAILPKNQLVISLAKKEEEIYAPNRPPIHADRLGNETKLFLQHLRDEAHRFAISYHRKLRGNSMFE